MPNLSTLTVRQLTNPVFRVRASTITTILPTGTNTKIQFDVIDFDTNNNFSLVNNRYIPTIAGYYQFNGCATMLAPYASNAFAAIYKNNIQQAAGFQPVGTTAVASTSDIVYCNGSTDYVELHCSHVSGANRTVSPASGPVIFSGFLIRPN